jgi:hypothetical protein
MQVLKKLKTELSYDLEIPLLVIYPKEHNQDTIETFAHPCLMQYYSQQPSFGINRGALKLMSG